jgi:hypothetical protein
MDGYVIDASGRKHQVGIHDFSIDGCCVTGDYPIGERVTVLMPKVGSLSGRVRWSVIGKAGIRFERKVPNDRVHP